MRAARLGAYRARLLVQEVPAPVVGPDDVLVRVAAAALNPLDVRIQQGLASDLFPVRFPYTPGTDLAGVVEAVGARVGGWMAGAAVVARTDPREGGALAELAAVPARHLARLPAGLSLEEAAGAPTAAGAAWQALMETGGLRAGETVLVHAGAGGVGSFAVQIARNAGARVIATASGDGVEVVRSLGAHAVIDHRAEVFEALAREVDLVLDTVGGETQRRSFGVLRRGGRLVSTVEPPSVALSEAHGVEGGFVLHRPDAVRLSRLLVLIAAGSLRTQLDSVTPLEGLAEAFARQASGRARGKVVVTLRRR